MAIPYIPVDTIKIGDLEVCKLAVIGVMPARESKPGALKVLVFLSSGQTATVPVKEYPDLDSILNPRNANEREREENENLRSFQF